MTTSQLPATISERLRAATAVAHQQAESARFVDDLMSGRLDGAQYTRLAVQLYFVYCALEEVGDHLADDPVAAAVVDERLRRLPRLRADLAALGIDPDTVAPLPAVQRYVDDTGSYPESVGLSVWGTSAMRTSGDDIAEVLALLGVRP